MNQQMSLFTGNLKPITRRTTTWKTIDESWREFHEDNPHVGQLLRQMALSMKKRGFKHYGIGALWEVLRFSYAMQTNSDDYKLNNNYRALYARWLMETTPELNGFFEIRKRKAYGARS